MASRYIVIPAAYAILSCSATAALADGRLDGAYIGIQGTREHVTIKYDEMYDDGIDTGRVRIDGLGTSGFSGGLFAGYDIEVRGSHFALEGEYNASSSDITRVNTENGDEVYSYYLDPRHTFGASLRYGYEVVTDAMVYLRAGWVRTKFKDSDGFNANLDGWRLGGGLEAALSDRVSLRVEYVYTDYESFTNEEEEYYTIAYGVSSGNANLGLAVRF